MDKIFGSFSSFYVVTIIMRQMLVLAAEVAIRPRTTKLLLELLQTLDIRLQTTLMVMDSGLQSYFRQH